MDYENFFIIVKRRLRETANLVLAFIFFLTTLIIFFSFFSKHAPFKDALYSLWSGSLFGILLNFLPQVKRELDSTIKTYVLIKPLIVAVNQFEADIINEFGLPISKIETNGNYNIPKEDYRPDLIGRFVVIDYTRKGEGGGSYQYTMKEVLIQRLNTFTRTEKQLLDKMEKYGFHLYCPEAYDVFSNTDLDFFIHDKVDGKFIPWSKLEAVFIDLTRVVKRSHKLQSILEKSYGFKF